MTTVVLGSVFLPDIGEQLRVDLPDCWIREIDLGTRAIFPSNVDGLAPVLAEADVIIPIRGYVGERVLGLSPRCRLVQQFGVGVDAVDLDAARRRGIPVCNVPSKIGGNAESVAEMALLHLISAGRELSRLQELVAKEDFRAPTGTSLYGATICIVGFGNIGQALARLLRPFRCRVIGIRRRRGRGRGFVDVWAEDRLNEALGVADFVVVSLTLTPETVGFLGRAQFNAMKPGVRIVNVSRGGVIDRDALLGAFLEGRVAAAGLDVFWQEPISKADPILDQNVIATPHCGGLTDHMLAGTSQAVAENIRRVLSGRRPHHRADR